MKNTVIMMIGIPASGKSTKAKELTKDFNLEIVCPNDIRKELYGDVSIQGDGDKVFSIAFDRIGKLLQEGKNVVFDATNTASRRKYIQRLRDLGAEEIIGVYMDTPIDVCLKRNYARNDRSKPVPKRILYRMAENLEHNPPSSREFDRFIHAQWDPFYESFPISHLIEDKKTISTNKSTGSSQPEKE